jgi:hypothetical protein
MNENASDAIKNASAVAAIVKNQRRKNVSTRPSHQKKLANHANCPRNTPIQPLNKTSYPRHICLLNTIVGSAHAAMYKTRLARMTARLPQHPAPEKNGRLDLIGTIVF